MNKYYHKPISFVILLSLVIIGYIISMIFLVVYNNLNQYIMVISTVVLIFAFFMIAGRKFNPYITFDSRLSRLYKKIYYFFFTGIIGFIIFEVILGFLFGI